MATGNNPSQQSKRDRREEARETARRMREEAAKKAKRRRRVTQGSIIVGVVAVIAIVGAVIYSNAGSTTSAINPKNMLSGGILLTSPEKAVTTAAIEPGKSATPTTQKLDGKTAHIQIWLDYQCPNCENFETTNEATIKSMLAAGTATLEIHPVAILDNQNNNNYSTRSAAAVSCVANYDPNKFLDVSTVLFANQPDETTGTGLTNAKMLQLFATVGVSSPDITKCVNDQTFATFVNSQTAAVASNSQMINDNYNPPSFGTPTVVINGERYEGANTNATQFQNFIAAAVNDAGSKGTVTFPKPSSK